MKQERRNNLTTEQMDRINSEELRRGCDKRSEPVTCSGSYLTDSELIIISVPPWGIYFNTQTRYHLIDRRNRCRIIFLISTPANCNQSVDHSHCHCAGDRDFPPPFAVLWLSYDNSICNVQYNYTRQLICSA